MKDKLLKLITLFICLHGLAWTQKDSQSMTARDLLVILGNNHYTQSSPAFGQALIQDFKVSNNVFDFKFNDTPIRVRWIGEKSRLVMFNGRVFGHHELQDFANFQKSFQAKFALIDRSKKALLAKAGSRFMAHFETTGSFIDADSPIEEEEVADNQKRDDVEIVGRTDFQDLFLGAQADLFKDDAAIKDTEVGRKMAMMYMLMTGDSQMALGQFVFAFLGSLSCMSAPELGCEPGMGYVNDLGATPGSIDAPFW